ncbi:4-coumarate--CoA ligase 1-like [Diprion similis]|uniref:4-coumarate--CoA ligase 1-like n=1 Tax=Diprion similis TaxID=362088 RepID=UPI001EF976BA|nr:4-coumarate--CoA ligase 1-like [Diprion similis]
MTTLRRGTRRMWDLMENGKMIRNSSSRFISTEPKRPGIQDGKNGEKIFKSPFLSTNYPTMPVHEFVWENVGNWGDKVALKCGVTGRRYTYAGARDASNWVARSLLNMGFKKGDVIALVLPNLPETAIAFLGSVEAGLTVTTVNPHYTVDEISRQLINAGAKGVITNAEIATVVLKAARDSLPSKSPFIVIDDATLPVPSGSIPFKDLIDKGKSLPPVSNHPWNIDDVVVLPYSSGTTGLSKGVMLSHRNLVANMEQVKASTEHGVWNETTETYQEIVPLLLPTFHIYGMNAVMLPNLRLGVQLITLPKFTPQGFVDVFEKNKVTCFFLVPPLLLFLATAPMVTKKHIESIHAMTSGAAPIAGSDVERFYQKFDIDQSKLKFIQGYGLTETSPVTFLQTLKSKKYASIGNPVCDTEARLIDLSTNEDIVTPGKTGELWVRGDHVMKGYYNNEEATKNTLTPDGWLKTGDIAYFDEEFDFYITDRLKELIKVKGFQVPPAELEALLRTHPAIEEAAVIGIPDERSGELPRAFVLLKKDKTLKEKEVQDFVKGKVSDYKELKGGVIFVDNIPKNPSGKILRRVLKEQNVK